jgi:hypothetical protein
MIYTNQLVNNKSIHIFDNVFDAGLQFSIYTFVKSSYFKINGSDNNIIEQQHLTLSSNWTQNDLNESEFVLPDTITNIIPLTTNYIAEAININLCKPDDVFHVHTDNHISNSWTLLYYINKKWDVEWGGDTVFLKEDCQTVDFVSQYTPGRVVIFDSSIPHLIRPSTRLAPDYRFTMAIRYVPK